MRALGVAGLVVLLAAVWLWRLVATPMAQVTSSALSPAVVASRPSRDTPSPQDTSVKASPVAPAASRLTASPAASLPSARLPLTEATLAEANKAYDRGDYDEAKAVAIKLLASHPGQTRLLRVAISASCILGELDAQVLAWFRQLPEGDRAQMRTRCGRYGITLPS